MRKIKRVVLFGAGGHARVVADVFESRHIRVEGLFDDDKTLFGTKRIAWKVLGGLDDMIRFVKENEVNYFVAIGDNVLREKISEKIGKSTSQLPCTCIAPSTSISPHVKISKGVFIAPGVVINIGTVIEEGAIVNTSSSIDHDCIIGRFSSVQPGAHLGGGVKIGRRTMVGIGAKVMQYMTIGDDAVVGGGAMVTHNVKEKTTVVGVPAKRISL
ncbi:acetyltransferase [Candidatus Gottesmanbacteria bacterium]|nr:acetyltransferase [Candidatus Gottesmanbacteria bacterium]